MNFDDYFDSLESLKSVKKNDIPEIKCCDDPNNYICDDGVTMCKVCNSEITNIMNNP